MYIQIIPWGIYIFMFTATLHPAAKMQKLSGEKRIKKKCGEFVKCGILLAIFQMNLEDILSEMGKIQKDKYFMITQMQC